MNRIAWMCVALMGLAGCTMLGSEPSPRLRTDYLYEVPARGCFEECGGRVWTRETCEAHC